MSFKKIGTYLAILLIGLLLGGFLFNSSSDSDSNSNKDQATKAEKDGKWSCSMHPQIDGDQGGKCPLCGMDLVFMPNDQSAFESNFKMGEEAIALANVQTMRVTSSSTSDITVKLSGTITTNKKTDAVQTTLYDGRLDKLYYNSIGEKVYKGQQIGQIYSPELYLGQDRLFSSLNIRESHPALFASARYSMGLWKITDEQIDSMLISGKPMFDFPLYSDVSGTITKVFAEEGNFYEVGKPLYQVSDLRKVWAVFDAYENQLPLLKIGNMVKLYIPAVNEKIDAKIDLVEPILRTNQRVISVRVVLGNTTGRFKPGMFVEGLVHSQSQTKSILVPKSTVLWTGKRSLVYRKSNHNSNQFEMVEVVLGKSYNNSYEILSGLEIGDEVVFEGAFVIDAAAQLQGKKSMMTIDGDVGANIDEVLFEGHKLKDSQHKIKLLLKHKDDFQTLLGAYFDLKNALVATDFTKSKKYVNKLKATLHVLMEHNEIFGDEFNNLKAVLNVMGSSNDIQTLRHHFKPFSKSFIALIKSIDVLDKKVYVQYCPMADENRGATWLSLNKEIRNPYYGSQMLHCGTVKEEIIQQ